MGGGMGGGIGSGFNRWGNSGFNYQGMNGYTFVDYSGGWNAAIHDQMLKNNIDFVYQKYDYNFSGQLEGNEFFYAYSELCLRMGLCPPQNYQDVWNAVMAGDANMNGRVSKMEMFVLFKRIQGISTGMMMNQGMGMNMGFGGGMGGMGMGGMGYGVNMGGW
jgi:hypothetical protein